MHRTGLEAWLRAQANCRYQNSLWFDRRPLKVYLRAGPLKSYAGNCLIQGVRIANVSVETAHLRQGLLTKFVDNLLVSSRSLGYKELQVENVVSDEMLNFCRKCGFTRDASSFDDLCFWKPI